MNSRLTRFVMLVILAMACSVAHASSVIYWRFENSAASEYNSPTVDLALGSTAGYSTDAPGPLIDDGTSHYANNYSYDHGTGTVSDTSDYSVARAAIDSTVGFTIEYFVKIDEGATAAQKLRWDFVVGSDSWFMNLNANQLPQFGATTPAFPDETAQGATGYLISKGGTLSEGVWHHVAAVGTVVNDYPNSWTLYERVELFVDYASVGATNYYTQAGQTPEFPRFQWTDTNTHVGWQNAFDGGLLDEIRISDHALDPESFLKVYTGPATPTSCEEAWLLGYGLPEDLNKDCEVDIKDIEMLLQEWLECNDPEDSGC